MERILNAVNIYVKNSNLTIFFFAIITNQIYFSHNTYNKLFHNTFAAIISGDLIAIHKNKRSYAFINGDTKHAVANIQNIPLIENALPR